jgi:hypothetical protein
MSESSRSEVTQGRLRPGPLQWASAIVVLFLCLAGVAPEADPPHFLPGLFEHAVGEDKGLAPAREFLVEGPAKAHEARNFGLFGEFVRNPADTYRFWRVQAPVWVYPLAGTFRLFGVSYTTLRCFSVGIALIGFVGFLVLGRRLLPAPAALVGGLLLATNLYTSYFARSALIEVMTVSAAVWVTVCLVHARNSPVWAVASQVVFVLGFFAKQSLVFVFPALVLWNVLAFIGWVRQRRFARLRWLPVGTALCLAAVSAVHISRPEYVEKLLWSYDHMLAATDFPRPWTQRFHPLRFWWSCMVLVPGVGLLALPGALWLCALALRRRLSWGELVVLTWFLSSFAAVFLASFWAFRFAAVLIFPSYFIAAMVLARAWVALPWRRLTLAVAALSLALNLGFQIRRLTSLEHSIRDTATAVRTLIGERPAVLVGMYAMPILFGTPYDIYYMKAGFNTRTRSIQDLRVTHVLGQLEEQLLEDAGYAIASRPLGVFDVVGRELELREARYRRSFRASWWSSRRESEGVVNQVGNVATQSVRLGNSYEGFIEGTMKLPASESGSWTIQFRAQSDCEASRPTENVRVYIDGVLVDVFHNSPSCALFSADYAVSGPSFDYRFEFESPSDVFHDHLVVDSCLVVWTP